MTLIYGANSSGKSSVIHSTILARHVQDTDNFDVYLRNVGGEAVDLGKFRQFIHRLDDSRRVKWTMEMDRKAFAGDLTAKWREAHMKELLAEMEISFRLYRHSAVLLRLARGPQGFRERAPVHSGARTHFDHCYLLTYYIPMLASIDYALKFGNEMQ